MSKYKSTLTKFDYLDGIIDVWHFQFLQSCSFTYLIHSTNIIKVLSKNSTHVLKNTVSQYCLFLTIINELPKEIFFTEKAKTTLVMCVVKLNKL